MIKVTVLKIFDDTASALVRVKSNKIKPIEKKLNYIFDNPVMAKCAGRDWEHDERKRKKEKEKNQK